MGARRTRRSSRSSRRARRGDFVSSRPWIVYRRTLGVPSLISRYSNGVRARSAAREESAIAVHVDDLSASMRAALGLRG